MDSLRVVAVGYKRFFQGFVEYIAARLVDEFVPPVDTSIAHLAGALGKPAYVMLPYDACFRWMLDRDDTPWYPTLRLFRQSKPGQWPDVVAAIRSAVSGLIQ
jgi:hypothetical protein